MGRLTREHDWAGTVIGPPDQWPQSLRTTLSIILNSGFPMFLFWGKDLLCFYNDAYRPSLGNNGKHPFALGKPAADVWQEIWPDIKPLIDQVLAGKGPTWSEDELLPIYRNGQLEDVYWTFSYSPVSDETGNPAGVFITCTETTEKVRNMVKMQESRDQLQFAIEAAELGTFDYNPFTDRFTANDRLRGWLGANATGEIPLETALMAVAPTDREQVAAAFRAALLPSSGGSYDMEYTLVHPLTKKERIVNARGKVSFDSNNVAYRINGTVADITARLQAQQRLSVSERKLRQIILKAPVAISIFKGRDYVVDIVNERALELWGRHESDVIDKPILKAMPELEGQGIKALLDSVYDTGVPFSASELPVEIRRNGRQEQLLVSFVYDPLYDLNGKVNGIMTVGIEVTGQAHARRKVEESAQRVRTMVANAPFPIGVYVGREMRIELANQAILDVWGKGNDVIGKTYAEVLPELANQQVYKQLDDVFTTGVPYHAKNQLIQLVVDGRLQPFYFNYSFTPLYDTTGNIYGVMNTAADVSDLTLAKKKVEDTVAELSHTAARLKLALDAGRLGSYEVDLATNQIECTGQCKRNFGTADDAPITLADMRAMVLPEDRERRQTAFDKAVTDRAAYNVEYRVTWPDGSVHWIHAAGMPTYDEQGMPQKVIGVTAEITEQKLFAQQLEKQVQDRTAELEQKNLELEKMNDELKSFAYVSSHDLQEPLRKIQTFSSRILEKEHANLSDTGKDYFHRMQGAAKRMQALIEDLLSYSRTNNTEKVFEHTDLKQLVNEVLDDLKETIQAKQAAVIIGQACTINVIPFQFRQLLQNLLTNALKFSSPDRTPVIHISAQMEPGHIPGKPRAGNNRYCHISVADNGIGFDPEYREKIFELFQRLHGKSAYEGTGIGLSIVKKIVENHSGSITATGIPDEGATFDIYIPE